MNSVLCEDAACSQRQLKIRTYQVIPMTTRYCVALFKAIGRRICIILCIYACTHSFRVGLIEWVKNTKPLKEFLTDELNDSEKKSYQ